MFLQINKFKNEIIKKMVFTKCIEDITIKSYHIIIMN